MCVCVCVCVKKFVESDRMYVEKGKNKRCLVIRLFVPTRFDFKGFVRMQIFFIEIIFLLYEKQF